MRSDTAASSNKEDEESLRSRSSKAAFTRPGRSRISWLSKALSLIHTKKADAAAQLAAREATFNVLQEKAKHKETTARIEAELVQRKLELEQMEVKKQIEIARAKLKVYPEVEEFDDDMDSVEDDLFDTSPIQLDLETEATSLPPLNPLTPELAITDHAKTHPQMPELAVTGHKKACEDNCPSYPP